MDEEVFFPPFTGLQLVGLRGLLQALDVDPLVMERGGCDYPPEVQALIRKLHADLRAASSRKAAVAPSGGVASGGGSNAEVWEGIAAEAAEMFTDLKDMRGLLTEEADKLAYLKVAAGMMVKIVELGERAQNIKTVSAFQKRVLDVFDQVLNPEQRTRATEMLAP